MDRIIDGILGSTSPGMGTGAAIRRLFLRAQEAQYGVPGAINQSRPVSDPQNQTAASLLSFHNTARTLYGTITDCTAIGNVYRVQLEKFKQPVVAFYGGRTSNAIFGARELHTLQPGTMVTCIWHEHMPYAQILSTVPPAGTASNLGHHGILHGATRQRVDESHKQPFRFDGGKHVPTFLSGRPFDATCAGEVGWISETGIKILLDSFMAIMGVDESCQISFHYHDMLCRIAAYQLQIWSAVRECESFNDQDESQDWTGYAMYPWENLGLSARADPTTINAPAVWQVDKPFYGKMEPVDDYMMPFHREREYHGYLGQGFKRCLIAPPTEFSEEGDLGANDKTDIEQGTRAGFLSYLGGTGVTDAHHPGLFDQFVTADGRLCIQSAKGISIAKRAAIMLPSRRRRPEEPDGDNPENYKFSALLGGGEEHEITGDIETQGDHSGLNRALGVLDMHAYFFNYAGLHPFFYHAEDYKVYEESEADWAEGQSAAVPDFSQLASETYLDPEDYKKTWKIDHRYGEQNFYTLASSIDLLDDGGLMLSDGYGSCIRMTGGSIEISAPGDIWLRAGRNSILWSGYDTILRAKNSWDISATDGDGRLKAEKNLFGLAGNAGTGGILLESRGAGPQYDFEEPGAAVEFGGIALRSTKAAIVSWSQAVYIRTGGPDFPAGAIVFDAGKGSGIISAYSKSQINYIGESVTWHFNTDDLEVQGPSAMLSERISLIPGDTWVGGRLAVDGDGLFDGSVLCTKAMAAVDGAPTIGKLEGNALESVRDAIATGQELMEETIPQSPGQGTIDGILRPEFYDAERPGDDDVILKAEFSYRTQDDYQTENFVIYEDRWQQLGRISGQASNKWEETAVDVQGQDTYPFPGREAYEGDAYMQQSLEIFDVEAGRSKDRGQQPQLSDEYASPKFGEPQAVSLNEYIIIR